MSATWRAPWPNVVGARVTRAGSQRCRGRLLAGVCLGLIICAGVASSSDWARYAPGRLSDYARASVPGTTEFTNLPIRARVRHAEEFRPLQEDAQRHIRAWAEAMSVADAPGAFGQEVKLLEAGVAYWLPVQDVLVGVMKAKLRPEGEIDAFVVYIGQAPGRPIFLVNAFRHGEKQ